MEEFIIANPPAGIYRGDLPIGYSFYHVILDIYARYLSKTQGKKVICHKYSLNVLGKRAEELVDIEDEQEFKRALDFYVGWSIVRFRK